MKPISTTRRGLTLVEVLVILAILAALAAVVTPVVTQQIRRGAANRVAGDLTSIRTGVESFVADVQRYPGDIHDLTTAISSSDSDINSDSYPQGLINKWNGPYMDRVMTDSDSLSTGFGGYIQDDFVTVTHTNGVDYLTVIIHSVLSNDFDEVDDIIDDADGATAGRLRHAAGGASTPDTVKYLAIPIS